MIRLCYFRVTQRKEQRETAECTLPKEVFYLYLAPNNIVSQRWIIYENISTGVHADDTLVPHNLDGMDGIVLPAEDNHYFTYE
jgi:hypothetical protein